MKKLLIALFLLSSVGISKGMEEDFRAFEKNYVKIVNGWFGDRSAKAYPSFLISCARICNAKNGVVSRKCLAKCIHDIVAIKLQGYYNIKKIAHLSKSVYRAIDRFRTGWWDIDAIFSRHFGKNGKTPKQFYCKLTDIFDTGGKQFRKDTEEIFGSCDS